MPRRRWASRNNSSFSSSCFHPCEKGRGNCTRDVGNPSGMASAPRPMEHRQTLHWTHPQTQTSPSYFFPLFFFLPAVIVVFTWKQTDLRKNEPPNKTAPSSPQIQPPPIFPLIHSLYYPAGARRPGTKPRNPVSWAPALPK